MSSDLVTVILKSDGSEQIVEYSDAVILRQQGLIVVPPDDGKALTQEDVFGDDYEPSI